MPGTVRNRLPALRLGPWRRRKRATSAERMDRMERSSMFWWSLGMSSCAGWRAWSADGARADSGGEPTTSLTSASNCSRLALAAQVAGSRPYILVAGGAPEMIVVLGNIW